MLDDDDPLWEQHSGGIGHRGVEWGADDGALAEALYAPLPESTQFIFDLMMDRPGERLTSDWIAAEMSRRRAVGDREADRRSVSTSLSPVSGPHKVSGRRLPFYWWRGADGGASWYAMKPVVARLFREARQNTGPGHTEPSGGDWSNSEVRAAVDDYLAMLTAEMTGQRYSKAEHRRALRPRLNAVRTEAAIEFKHQNISAAMLDLGLPYIRGYKPRGNYQAALAMEIRRRLEADPRLLAALRAGTGGGTPPDGRLQRAPVPVPAALPTVTAPPARATDHRRGRHPDYGLLQEENRRRGAQGEELVVDYERRWLRQSGRPDLADRVRWTAREDGDGLGYDVLSFDLDGRERYIEVKTTALGAETPFYISSAELAFAHRHADHYVMYRLYGVLDEPRFFGLEGDIAPGLELNPVTYSARIAATAPASSVPPTAEQ
jgi:hypothetical protein